MKKINNNAINNINIIKNKTGNSPDILIKKLNIFNKNIFIVYNEVLIDKEFVDKYVLLYFNSQLKYDLKKKDINIIEYFEKTIPTHKIIRIDNFDNLFYNLLSGFTLIIIDGYEEVLSLETKAKLDSGVLEAKNEKTTKGPKDAFTENYQTNIGLIRKRNKTASIWLEELIVGRRSKTKVGILYDEDIINKGLVEEVKKKIESIDIDNIPDSNYIIELISENKNNFFPNFISTERPDIVSKYIAEGRIAIVVENTPYVIIIPALFVDFFHAPDDYYSKIPNTNFMRYIRFVALIFAILAPAIYIAITTFNIEAIPEKLVMSFASQREGVPFPTIIETLMMIIVFEILRETDIRLPSAIGNSLSIVGAIVLGQAAVAAGIVSPITIIVVSITSISGMITYNVDMVNAMRWWRIIFLIFSSIFGLYGIIVTGFFFIVYITSIKSFGIPFLSPFAPLNTNNQNDAFFMTDRYKFEKRNILTSYKNINRSGKNEKI